MAQLQSSNKNIHVTVQKANPDQQLQPNIQEVQLGGQNGGLINGVGLQGSNNGRIQNANSIAIHLFHLFCLSGATDLQQADQGFYAICIAL